MKVSLARSVSFSHMFIHLRTHHSNIPSVIAAFAIPHTVPKHTLSLVITAIEIELRAQINDIVPSTAVKSPGQLSLESANHAGTASR